MTAIPESIVKTIVLVHGGFVDGSGWGDVYKIHKLYTPEDSAVVFIEQTKLVATSVKGQVVAGSGHWLIDEAPQTTIPALSTFLNAQP